MKMLLLVFNISIQEEISELVENSGLICFTQWPRVIGRGRSTPPKLDNNVWPGANSAMMIAAEDTQARDFMKRVDEFRRGSGKREGVKAFLLNIEDMTGAP